MQVKTRAQGKRTVATDEGNGPVNALDRAMRRLEPDDAACTLNVSLRDSRGALGRIAATLSSMPVLALSYGVADASRATAEIRLPRAHVARARGRLNRMVDVLDVTDSVVRSR
ncbi:hypothetical protein KN815_01505 [Streptomyces sp. 4503]|uniref:ACT domain-containing protein n=1 Tax=Streptomyces niphimycinicus TaxID=2842201 RepID=A0ABS6C7H4_9ACTN|nr:hypothetical protein [Streptomyces niphimycinicus]